MKNKKIIITIIVLALIVIITGVLLIVFSDDQKPSDKKIKEAQESTKEVVDGDMTNIQESLKKQHIYEDYRIKSLVISGGEGFYMLSFTVDNISEKNLEKQKINIAFLDSNKKQISEVNVEIPALSSGESQYVYYDGLSEKTFNYAFDYKISKAKEASLPNKE